MEFNGAGFRLRRRITPARAIFEKTGLPLEFAGDPVQGGMRTASVVNQGKAEKKIEPKRF